MYTFTREELEELVAFGRRCGLWGMNLISDDWERARRVCNGIGPEWFHPWARKLVGIICYYLRVISLPHDIEYQEGGRLWKGMWKRWVADWHFVCNGLRVAWYLFRCLTLRKTAVIVAAKALLLWLLLRVGGVGAFNWRKKRKGAK